MQFRDYSPLDSLYLHDRYGSLSQPQLEAQPQAGGVLPRPSRPAPPDARDWPQVQEVIKDLDAVIQKMENIPSIGDYPWFRCKLYTILQRQGDHGAIKGDLECPVCYEIFNTTTKEPVIYTCGHTTCKSCYYGWPTCGICRATRPPQPVINQALRDIAKKLVPIQ